MDSERPVTTESGANENAGVLYAVMAYVMWGITPLYWHVIREVPLAEIMAHRIVWCALFLLIVTVVMGNLRRVIGAMCTPRTVLTLALAGFTVAINWSIFIYCVATDQIIEVSLGFYITPLLSFVIGALFLGERMSRVRVLAICLAALAVAIEAIAVGKLTWVAPSLALTFTLYGFIKKHVAIPALDGLLVETALLSPIALACIVWWASHDTAAFGQSTTLTQALLIGSGPVTAIPLVLFAAGARRIRLTTLAFVQYIAPSMALMLAVFVFGEAFTLTDGLVFSLVWLALLAVALEGRGVRFWRSRSPA